MQSAPTFTLNSYTPIDDASVRGGWTLRNLHQTDRLIGVTRPSGKLRGIRRSPGWSTAKLGRDAVFQPIERPFNQQVRQTGDPQHEEDVLWEMMNPSLLSWM